MKKIAILVLMGCWLPACQDNDALPALEKEEIVELMKQRIGEKTILLDSAYRLTAALLAKEPISEKMLAENSKQQFIAAMNKRTSGVFKDAIGKCRSVLSLERESYLPEKPQKDIFIEYVLSDEPDPLGDYRDKVHDDAAAPSRREKDGWIHIESFVIDTQSHGPVATEQMSLNFEQIRNMLTVFDLIMKHKNESDLDNALGKFTAEHADTTLLAALLLPAVQRVYSAVPGHATLMDGTLTDPVLVKKGYDDRALLLQRQRAAAFLSGLHLLVGGDYDNSTVDATSINVLYAMHQNLMTMLWSQVWDQYRD